MKIVMVSNVPFTPEIGTPYHLSIALGRRCSVTLITPVLSLKQKRATEHAARGHPVKLLTPVFPTGARALPRRWRDAFHAKWILFTTAHLLKRQGTHFDVLWAFFTETALQLDARVGPKIFCYHRLDDFQAMIPERASLETRLMQRADLNFIVTPSLSDPQCMRPGSWVYLPNGVATDIFVKAQKETTEIPRELTALPTPRIGYIGSVHPDWVDVELMIALADATPQWSWVIIGPKIRWDPPKNLPRNLHFVGMRPYLRLPSYLKGLDVCVIPFRDNAISHGASPLKLYEYLAAGKAVVSVPYFHDLHQFGDLVYTARTISEWQDALRDALSEAHCAQRIAQRMQSVAEHSWDARAETALRTLISAC